MFIIDLLLDGGVVDFFALRLGLNLLNIILKCLQSFINLVLLLNYLLTGLVQSLDVLVILQNKTISSFTVLFLALEPRFKLLNTEWQLINLRENGIKVCVVLHDNLWLYLRNLLHLHLCLLLTLLNIDLKLLLHGHHLLVDSWVYLIHIHLQRLALLNRHVRRLLSGNLRLILLLLLNRVYHRLEFVDMMVLLV